MTSPEPEKGARAAVARLRRARTVLVTSHASPDGDALGSALAMRELAGAMGLRARVVLHDAHPASLDFLPGIEEIEVRGELPAGAGQEFDLAVVLECPGLDRPALAGLETLPILNIDHHLENAGYGEVNYVDEEAPAVGEMILAMADAAGVAVSASMAVNLYTALVTDTGDFRYSNATPRAFAAARRLVAAGARPDVIAEGLWNRVPARVVRLTAAVLATLELHAGGRLALITCDRETLAAADARPEDTENLINVPRSIDGVEVAVLLKGFAVGVTRVSLRSRRDFDVQEVAARFGGGGHRNAAGCSIQAPLPEARRELLALLSAKLETR